MRYVYITIACIALLYGPKGMYSSTSPSTAFISPKPLERAKQELIILNGMLKEYLDAKKTRETALSGQWAMIGQAIAQNIIPFTITLLPCFLSPRAAAALQETMDFSDQVEAAQQAAEGNLSPSEGLQTVLETGLQVAQTIASQRQASSTYQRLGGEITEQINKVVKALDEAQAVCMHRKHMPEHLKKTAAELPDLVRQCSTLLDRYEQAFQGQSGSTMPKINKSLLGRLQEIFDTYQKVLVP